ncbi:MAG: DUF4390 domain-containing protein [Burkholderiales bacterium]|nr:DUF4390 domain-containing protein [Burkholderiales bacterium]MBK8667169.1 DUF4390 domain-containing protein [Burkholderiales bacterium]
MAFITPCWPGARSRAGWLVWLLTAWLCLLPLPLAAAAPAVELNELHVERADDGLYLSAQLQVQLPSVVEDALDKGIPVHFVLEADILRERWYWSDQKLVSARRYLRIAYQPLTRRWRLNVSSEPIANTGLGVSLSQHYDSLGEVMAAVERIARWRIADAAALDEGGRQFLRFQFRLDVGQLPRTFRIGTVGPSDWAISVERRIELTPELGR